MISGFNSENNISTATYVDFADDIMMININHNLHMKLHRIIKYNKNKHNV